MKTLVKLLAFLPSLFLFPHPLLAVPALPEALTRARMITELAAEMERLDGEGLLVRENRPKSFRNVVSGLASEAENARDWHALLKVFHRLDHAYPNLHARMVPGSWWKESRGNLQPIALFRADWLEPNRVEYRISSVEKGFSGAQVGDRVIAINGRSMAEISEEYFEFCKMALKAQCDFELPKFLEFAEPTIYSLERGSERFEQIIPLERIQPSLAGYEPCAEDKDLYPGFAMKYAGRYACFFEKINDPATLLLRIRSFHYKNAEEKNEKIASVRQEVDALWPWWRERAALTKHLVIDLAGNGGGNAPIPYYEIFFPRPFQEQWVSFRKLPEMLNAKLRESVFWGEEAQETWFQNILKEGLWDRIAEGEFLPPVPMFCAGKKRDCRETLFSPRDHGFRGQVSLVVNSSCVSSCDGFVYAFHEEMGARIIGQPQAADSAYSRLSIYLLPDATQGFRLQVAAHTDPIPEQAFLSQIIAFSRSVSSDGRVVSGIPVPVDDFVPRYHHQTAQDWRRAAVAVSLQ
jgi:hypothetical protein